ncbi:GntR family transcriptional regulator [Rhizobium alvei]|uniref:GntR family transcriptional regulator n=1 Tax=Rhizobium alvei TaxID=1132659 RepID=A0ABT8YKG4_9HYPH|nr:GntR family transcriptional regulator [Rhizobium alvei]MDO6964145.1 GntR family transcriptional regulator [Rhizobium alvei]
MEENSGKVRHRHVELAQKILDYIIERGLPQGGRLTEQALASHCNVSRTPIRKALSILADKGIVRPEPEGGYQLAIDPASFSGLAEETIPAEENEIYSAILRDVGAGRIGDSQTVASLQRRYNASRNAVQNALMRLAEENLAERAPGQQWLIKQFAISGDAVAKSYEFRLACEPLALTMPGFRRDAAAMMSLRQSMEFLRAQSESQFDHKLFERTDFDFHMLIAKGSGNPFMSEALITHHRRRKTSQPQMHVNLFRLMQSNLEHLQILEQIEREQFDLAADLLRVHIQLSHFERPRLAGRGVPIAFRIAG